MSYYIYISPIQPRVCRFKRRAYSDTLRLTQPTLYIYHLGALYNHLHFTTTTTQLNSIQPTLNSETITMRDTPSKFIEILDPKDEDLRLSDSDVRLEDVLADHEATISSRPRSSTQSSTKPLDKPPFERTNSSSPTRRWKRLSTILAQPRRSS